MIDPARRGEFVIDASTGDPSIRALVDALLLAHEDAGSFLNDITSDGPELAAALNNAGDSIGPYLLLERIGEGGFGSVWKAEQQHPVRRIVALKIIKLGMDTQRVIARFDAERQALAMMNHPNIARVFDAGATDFGRPYFVMEFVDGQRITSYCRHKHLTISQMLEMYIHVCRAIEHAHQKGIVHRDIKPGNVLVTEIDGEPTVKVIDFGIAKATSTRLTEMTLGTERGLIVGTPQYMSPEQADLQEIDIDTRSDVYALGVLLYEMLTGDTPIQFGDMNKIGYAELLQAIREQEPVRPSVHRPELRGDIETIILKSLHKNRDHRYQSAGDLAADVQRSLNDEPITARPPTAMYHLNKFARRHKPLVAGAMAVAIVVVAGTVVSTVFAVGQSRARADADLRTLAVEAAQVETEKISEAQRTMLASIDPQAIGNELIAALQAHFESKSDAAALESDASSMFADLNAADLARSILGRGWIEPASAAMERDLADHPFVHADMLGAMADIYRNLGQPDLAMPFAERSYELFCAARGPQNEYSIGALGNIAILIAEQGDLAAAEPNYRKAFEDAEQFLGPDHQTTLTQLSNLAWLLAQLGQMDEANELTIEVAQRMRRVMGPNHEHTIMTTQNAAVALERMGRNDEAADMHRQALAGAEQAWGPEHVFSLTIEHNLAVVLQKQEHYDEALQRLESIRDRAINALGREHTRTARAYLQIGRVYSAQDRFSDALPNFEAAVDISLGSRGPDHPETLKAQTGLGGCLSKLGRRDEARAVLEQTLDLLRNKFDETHPDVRLTLTYLAELDANAEH